MFSNLSERLSKTINNLRGQGRLTEKNIKDTMREVRMALLEADVANSVVKQFIADVEQKALGQEVLTSLKPGEVMVKLVHDELVKIMGETSSEIDLQTQPPAVIMVAGLQGSGKTTSVAKLAKYLQEEQKKSVMVTSADIYRPAAIKQLETLAEQVGTAYHHSDAKQKPADIVTSAIDAAKREFKDILIIDTAGRMHVDDEMMAEIKQLHKIAKPIETLFVVDSMTGQDAANTAKAFHDALALTGVILTKTDGDARGGAALSVRMITGKPIKFIGSGEKVDALEVFHPERVASRILDMGDVLTLVEEVHKKVDEKKAKKLAKKIQKGQGFDLEDFREQLQQMRNMGGVGSLLGKLPGMGQLPKAAKDAINDKTFTQMEAIINSMTPQERHFPQIIKASRKKRIANGSGTSLQAVNKVLKQHQQMQKMMKKMKGGGMMKMMGQLKGMMPPGGGNLPF